MSEKKRFYSYHIIPFLVALAACALLIFLVTAYVPNQLPDDLAARIARLETAGQYAETLPLYVRSLAQDPLNVDLHYAYIESYFKAFPGESQSTEHQEIAAQYEAYAKDRSTSDLGFFGLGLINALRGEAEQALSDFNQVQNRHLRHLNNALGEVYLDLNQKDRAVEYFEREIATRGDRAGAVSELVRIYTEQDQLAKIQTLLADRETASFVDFKSRRQLARQTGDWLAYLDLTFRQLPQQIAWPAALGAILTGAVWFILLRRIAVFRPQPLPILALALLLGAFSALASLVLGDTLRVLLPIPPEGPWYQDLLRDFLYTGTVEELAKFMPVLLIVGLLRSPQEPFDLLLLGGMSALGFATLENSLYFTRYNLSLIYSRFLYSSVMHLAMTGILCYAWAKILALRKGNLFLQVSKGLLIAALVHGLYDYFLLTADKRFSILSIFLILLLISEYHRMIRNTLNFSPFFCRTPESSRRWTNFGLLSCAILGLFAVVFVSDHFRISTEFARRGMLPLVLVSLPIIIVLLGSFSRIKPHFQEWTPLFNYRKHWSRLSSLRKVSHRLLWSLPLHSVKFKPE